ncbi:unnamed protein product, partial [Chrysoparadoxa australica]
KLIVFFTDDSQLHAREYIGQTERSYSFHWQTGNNLICRWDNAPHHIQLKTFPNHMHTPAGLEESPPVTLQEVLDYIESKIEQASSG